MENIIQFVLQMAVQNPKIAAVILVIGSFRVLMKPIMELLKAYVLITPSKKDDELLDKAEKSQLYKIVMFILDYAFSIKSLEKK